jgi:hypothetical protein
LCSLASGRIDWDRNVKNLKARHFYIGCREDVGFFRFLLENKIQHLFENVIVLMAAVHLLEFA